MDTIKGKNVLITGGTGFIGSNLAKEISSKNANLSILKTRLGNRDELIKETKDIDVIFHLAGEVLAPKKEDLPQKNFEVNTIGTLNILDAGRINDVEQIIFSSTMSIFGNPKYLPVNEKHERNPSTFYGLSKLAAEECCRLYTKLYDMNITILRYSSVYGKGQKPDWVIPIFIKNALNGEAITIFGSGDNTGDFVHVEDIIKANLLATLNKKAYDEDFNIGSGKEKSINELAEIIRKQLNPAIEIRHNHINDEKSRRFVFDISKAKKLMGYSPVHTIADFIGDYNVKLMRK